LVRILASTACANGNTLVSWGPHWDGAFDDKEIARFLEVGDWLKSNGVSIYNTRGGPWLPASWGGSTHHGNTVYLHVLDPQLATLTLPPIPAKVESATLLTSGATLAFTQTDRGLNLDLPPQKRDPADTVVVLQLNQPVTTTVRSGASANPFDDPVAYGKILLVQTNVPVSGEVATFDLKTLRKVTGVVVEQAAGGSPISLSLSADNINWTQAAASQQSSARWEATVDSEAVGALLPGRNARYVKITIPGVHADYMIRRVQIHGF
jgi:alpha-L-fucosidase